MERKRENRRAFIASQSQITNTSRQSALPATMIQDQGNEPTQNRVGQDNQDTIGM